MFHVLPQIEESHRRLIEKASHTPFAPNRKNAHSSGGINFLNEYLNLSLSQPAYYTPSFKEDSVLEAMAFSDEADQFPETDAELFGLEGEQKFVTHLRRERDTKIVQAKSNKSYEN